MKLFPLVILSNGHRASLEVGKVILSAGSWSGVLSKLLRLNLPMQAGKGYSVRKSQLPNKTIHIPNILVEARVAISLVSGKSVRFGGTMEIGGLESTINMNSVRGIIKSVPEFFQIMLSNCPKKRKYGMDLGRVRQMDCPILDIQGPSKICLSTMGMLCWALAWHLLQENL